MAKQELVIAGIPSKDIKNMEDVCNQFSLENISSELDTNRFSSAFTLAEGIKQLHVAITPEMMKPIMFLQGNQLGFLTDKDRDGGYSKDVVKNCCVQALLMGATLAGNEFNIIAGKTYLTLNHFVRKVKETPGLTDFDYSIGMKSADVVPGTTIDVQFKATWNLDGKPMEIEGSIPIRINKMMGADAVIGKTRRKMLAMVVQKIQGSLHTMPEGDIYDCDGPDIKRVGYNREIAAIDVTDTLGVATEETTAPGGTAESALQPKKQQPEPEEEAVPDPEPEDDSPEMPDEAPEPEETDDDEPPAADKAASEVHQAAPDDSDGQDTEDEPNIIDQVIEAWKAGLKKAKNYDADDELVVWQIEDYCMNYWAEMSFNDVATKKPAWLPKLIGYCNEGKIPTERYAYKLAEAKKAAKERKGSDKPKRPGDKKEEKF